MNEKYYIFVMKKNKQYIIFYKILLLYYIKLYYIL